MVAFLSRLGWLERAVIVLSLLFASFLIIDPLVLFATRHFDEGTRTLFKSFTNLGKSGWILVPLGLAIIALHLFRRREYGLRRAAVADHLIQLCAFLFISVAGASLAGSLIKNILGRARPKHFDALGPVEFQPFTFDYGFASFPSGHATTICALGAALAILWPRGRVLLFTAAAWIAATRFLIGSHYFTDVAGGAALGFSFPHLVSQRMALRRWLFSRDGEGRIILRGEILRAWIRDRAARRGPGGLLRPRGGRKARYSGHS
ncbi:MAG: phosphatase PAP2 family protein [Methyloligellaceae bacterium]